MHDTSAPTLNALTESAISWSLVVMNVSISRAERVGNDDSALSADSLIDKLVGVKELL